MLETNKILAVFLRVTHEFGAKWTPYAVSFIINDI